jgi:hypothetical protein
MVHAPLFEAQLGAFRAAAVINQQNAIAILTTTMRKKPAKTFKRSAGLILLIPTCIFEQDTQHKQNESIAIYIN